MDLDAVREWMTVDSPLWFAVSALALSGFTLGLLLVRRRLGVGWLWLWVGAATVLMWLGYGDNWLVPGPTGLPVLVASGLLAPALLMLMLLVYVEHGAADARRVAGGIIATSFLYQGLAALPDFGPGIHLPAAGWQMVLGGTLGFSAGLAAMAVLYQILTNIRFAPPVSLRFAVALLAGTFVHGGVFMLVGLGGPTDFILLDPSAFATAKLVAGMILSLPAAAYLHWQHHMGRRLAVQDMGPLAIAGLGTEGPVPTFETWRAMAETLGDGMTASADSHIIFANAAMARIAGYRDGEAMAGLPFAQFVRDEDLERLLGNHRLRLEGALNATSYEWHLRRLDGQVRTLATTATPALLGGRRVVIEIHRDVTLERETHEKLEASNLAVHALVAGASALVPSLNPEKIIASVAEQAARLVGAEFVVFFEKKSGADRLVCRHIEGAAYGILVGEEVSPDEYANVGYLPRSGARHSMPLLADGLELGLLMIGLRQEGRQFTWDELGLLDALGAMGAAALRTSQLVRNLRDAEQRYATLFDQVPTPVWLFDMETLHLHAANQAAIRRYGWSRDEFLNMLLGELAPPPAFEGLVAGARPSGSQAPPPFLTRHRDKTGEEFDVLMSVSHVEIGGVRWGLAASVDLTVDRKNQERQQNSQRLESLGRLAGGIAHDFNNILTALQVDLALLVGDYQDHEPLQRELAHILAAVERASDLTRQILLFSRGEEAKRRPVHLNEAVRTIERLLMRSLGETVDLVVDLHPANPMVSADPAQLQLALVNLCLNGRDAMPLGGVLKVTSKRQELDPATAERLGMRPGMAAVLVVADTGSGMTPEILGRAMEPFFTTKKADRGTGLGLSIVHGVARAHDGAVEIESQVGAGTRVTLYVPELLESVAPEGAEAPRNLRGGETVLLVDDEPAIRRAGGRMLERYGYRVVVAEDGEAALRKLEDPAEHIDLVITDMVMPRLDARGLIEVVRRKWPDLPVLLSTGYDDNRLSAGISELFNALVAKPYTPDEILGAVRDVLDGVRP